MKIFLKAICVYILLGLLAILYTIFFADINNLVGFFYTNNVFVNYASFFIKTIPYLITIMFCAIRIQKKGEKFFIRLIPFLLIIGIIFSALISFIDLANVSESFYWFANVVHTIIQSANYFLLPVCILSNLNPNNVIARFFKIGSYIADAACVVSIIVLYIKIFMVTKLPNVYGYDGFNFSTIAATESTVSTIVVVAVIVGLTFMLLGFISNCAFEAETIESDSLSYDELLAQADKVAEQKRQEIYGQKTVEPVIDRSVSETTGMMNVNNQLTAGSNVGVVNKDSLGVSLVEGGIPTSSGPVMNSTVPTPTVATTETPAVEKVVQPSTPATEPPTQAPAPVQAPQQPVASLTDKKDSSNIEVI